MLGLALTNVPVIIGILVKHGHHDELHEDFSVPEMHFGSLDKGFTRLEVQLQ